MGKRVTQRDRRLAQLNKELLSKLRPKQEIQMRWKQGQNTWDEYRDVARVYKNASRKAKVHLELNLGRRFYNYFAVSKTNTSTKKLKIKERNLV